MEILNNLSSIYCFIAFILGAMFIFTTLCIVSMCKVREPRNKVHFYVARDKNGSLWVYMCKPVRDNDEFKATIIVSPRWRFEYFGLNPDDFKNLKWQDEPVEVFINLED